MRLYRLFVFSVLFLAAAASAQADFMCEAEVSFKWKRGKEDTEQSVPYVSVQQAGPDEAAAKNALTEFLGTEREKARTACREAHQNLARCIASKFSATGAVMQTMTFSARKALEEAITKDCEREQGICGEVAASEPKCIERKTPGADQAEAGKKEAGKDKDKGKAKK